MREPGIWRVGPIFIPCLVVVKQRRLSPPVAPRHPVVAVAEQRPFPDALQEDAHIEAPPPAVEIETIGVARCCIPQTDDITVLTRSIAVQADFPVTVHILVSSFAWLRISPSNTYPKYVLTG